MKTDKRLTFSVSDAGADARTTFQRFSHGVVGLVDATTDFLVSIIVNVIGFFGSLIGEILTRMVKAPLITAMLGLLGGTAAIGVDHLGYVDRQIRFNTDGFLHDLWSITGKITDKVSSGLSRLPLPRIHFPQIVKNDPELRDTRRRIKEEFDNRRQLHRPQPSRHSWLERGSQTAQTSPQQGHVPASYFEGEQAPIYSVPSAYQASPAHQPPRGRVYSAQPEVASSGVDRLGAFINQRTFVNHQALSSRFRVAQNAYRTAKIHGLSFRPGTNIDATLRNCRWLSEGAYIRFVLNDQGYVIGCHVTR